MADSRLTGWRLPAWTALGAALVYFVIVGGGLPGVMSPYIRTFNIILAVIAMTIWLAIAVFRPEWRPRTTLWWPIVAVLAAFLVSTAFSRVPDVSRDYLAYLPLLLAGYLLLVRLLAHPAFGPRVRAFSLLVCVAICLLYLGIVLVRWAEWWGLVGRIAVPPLRPGFEQLTYANPSGVAAMALLLVAPVSAWQLERHGRSRKRVVFLLALAATVVLVSGSRGAWLGAAGAIAVAVLLAAATRAVSVQALRALSPRVALAAVALVIGLAIVVAPAVLQRAFAGGGDSLGITLAATTGRMFVDAPATGVGPGAWAVLRAKYTQAGEVDYYIPHAHNVPLQTVAELGLVGVATGLVVAFGVARLLIRSLTGGDKRNQLLAVAAGSGLTYLGLHDLVDFHLNLPAILFALALPIAAIDARVSSDRERESSPGRTSAALSVVLGLAVVAAGGLALMPEKAAIELFGAAEAADEGSWERAYQHARLAAASDPESAAAAYVLGVTGSHVGGSSEATIESLRAAAAEDDFAQGWLNIAALEIGRGHDEAASAALDNAQRLGRQQPAVLVAAAHLAIELGDDGRASELVAQALNLAPALGDDPHWESTPQLAAAFDAGVEDAMARATPDTRLLLGLVTGDIEAARDAAAQIQATVGLPADLVVRAWMGDDTARAALSQRAEERPLDSWLVGWSARLAAHAGDPASTLRFRRWAAIAGTDTGFDVVVTDAPVAGLQPPGPNANFHGWYTYRRAFPWDLLVGGLPKLTLR